MPQGCISNGMTRWIAFDEEGTAAVALQTRAAVTFQRGCAFISALANGRNGIVILPTGQTGQVTLLRLRPNLPTAAETPVEPAGFLGLTNRAIIELEPEPTRKWWQRILG